MGASFGPLPEIAMHERFACPQGHKWQIRIDGPSTPQPHPCPVCGAPGTVLTPAGQTAAVPGSATAAALPSSLPETPPADEPGTLTWRNEAAGQDSPDPPPPPATATRPGAKTQVAGITSRMEGPPAPGGAGAEVTPNSPTVGAPRPVERPAPALPTIAGYEVLGVLGRGGMGVVYKARQPGLNRLVALKMIRAGGHADERELARFRAEAVAVARLRHPNIVQVYEVGEHDGLPFFSLEYVEGGPLSKRLDGTPLPPRQAAELAEALARAMHYAHTEHIVHRDLKPANVLLQIADCRLQTEEQSVQSAICNLQSAIPKITDFGIAKRLDQEKGQTRTGAVMGTPSYMPPEQAAGRTKEVGPLSDVYALGAILYEMLTGRPPFKGETLMDTVRQVTSDEPVPPTRLNSKVPRDLQVICLKCLEKDPRRRYASAGELADDLRRWLGGEPIRARPAGAAERAVKWARRRPAAALLLGVSALAALAVLGLGAWHYADTQAYNARLRAEKGRADDERDRAKDNEEKANRERERAEERELAARRYWYVSDMNLVQHQAWEQNQVARALELLERQRPQDGQQDLRGFEWYYWRRLCHSALLTLGGHTRPVQAVACTRDGKTLITGGDDGAVKFWDAETGRPQGEPLPLPASPVKALALSPDGKELAVGHLHGTIERWNVAARTEVRPPLRIRPKVKGALPPAVVALAYSPDGKSLAFAAADGQVAQWEPGTGQVRPAHAHAGRALALAYSPDGKVLATGGDDKVIKLWDTNADKELRSPLAGHTDRIWSLAFAPDGKALASGSDDRTIKLWDVGTWKERAALTGHKGGVVAVAFAPGGRLASGSYDQTVKLWDVGTGQELSTRKGHGAKVNAVAFASDGRLASASDDTTVKVWDALRDPERTLLRGHAKWVESVAFAPVGQVLATAGQDETVRLWDPETGKELRLLRPGQGTVFGVAFSPDGKLLATAGADRTVKLWEADTGKELTTLQGHTDRVKCVTFSPDGKTLASGGYDKTIRLWDVPLRKPLRTLEGQQARVMGLAFAPDGQTLAAGGDVPGGIDGVVRLWDPGTGQVRATLAGHHAKPVHAVAFAPDGRTLASGDDAGGVNVWDAATGRPLASLGGHAGMVRSLAFSPDGRELATAAGAVRLWDLTTHQERVSLAGRESWYTAVAWSPDGHRLAAGSHQGLVALWDGTNLPREP
jgi:WD40 repeat protein